MQHSVVMAVSNASDELIEKGLEHWQLQAPFDLVKILLEVVIQELKYESELALRVNHIV